LIDQDFDITGALKRSLKLHAKVGWSFKYGDE
jgi:hypothetical protein